MGGRMLIVGGSHSGVAIASGLRDLGYAGGVDLVTAEAHLPYERPPLSKAYLLGHADKESLLMRSPEFYEANDISVHLGERVERVDLEKRTAFTTNGEYGFDRLALTTGARARRLAIPGAALEGIYYLRDLTDADDLSAAFTRAQRVVIVGGGFIGLEAAAVARASGNDVTVVEAFDRLIARAVAPEVSQFLKEAHERRGVEVLLAQGVDGFVGENGRLAGISLSSGEVVTADIAIVGIGVVPRLELAEQMGLDTAGGIRVDEYAVTSNPLVVAAGDCTVFRHPELSDVWIRLESVQNAAAQGRVAAASMLGLQQASDELPWFWSNQYDLRLQIAGLSHGYDDVAIRGDRDAEAFSALYYREGRLIAVDSFNRPADFMASRRGLGAGLSVDRTDAEGDGKPLKSLFH